MKKFTLPLFLLLASTSAEARVSWNQLLSKQLRSHRDHAIVKMTDPRVKQIPIREQNEAWVDLNDPAINPPTSKIKLMPPDKRAQHADFAKMRRGLFQAIQRCVEFLPGSHTGVAIFEAYRPLSVQKQYFETALAQMRKENPKMSDAEAMDKASTLVSPVEDHVPPHSTGAAVDMVLVDVNRFSPLPMGRFGAIWGSNPHAQTFIMDGIDNEELENRKRLYLAATQAGLVNYPEEWWHFSLGDRYAAFALEEPYAVYGTEAPHFEEFNRLSPSVPLKTQ